MEWMNTNVDCNLYSVELDGILLAIAGLARLLHFLLFFSGSLVDSSSIWLYQ